MSATGQTRIISFQQTTEYSPTSPRTLHQMPLKYIESTGELKPGQCQNDIWLTPGNPANPADGDIRLIIQTLNPFINILYVEQYLQLQWWVIPVPPTVTLVDEAIGPLDRVIIPPETVVNRNILGPSVVGYALSRGRRLTLSGGGSGVLSRFYYYPHEPRIGDEQYLRPKSTVASPPITSTTLQWGEEIDMYREAVELI